MNFLEKHQTSILILSILIGLGLSTIKTISKISGAFVVPCLFLMLLGLFASIDLKHMRAALKNTRFLTTVVVTNFIISPLVAYLVGYPFLSSNPLLWIGFVLLMSAPCTDWYLVFTSMAKGDMALSTSVLPINLILQVAMLPVYLLIFSGTTATVPMGLFAESIITLLLLPFLAGRLVGFLLGKSNDAVKSNGFDFLEKSQTPFLCLAVMAMFASNGQTLLANPKIILWLAVPMLIYMAIIMGISVLISKVLKFQHPQKASLIITAMTKNAPITLGIAVLAFPNQPVIALAMAIEPLIELPLLSIIAPLLGKNSKFRATKKRDGSPFL